MNIFVNHMNYIQYICFHFKSDPGPVNHFSVITHDGPSHAETHPETYLGLLYLFFPVVDFTKYSSSLDFTKYSSSQLLRWEVDCVQCILIYGPPHPSCFTSAVECSVQVCPLTNGLLHWL